MCYQTICSKCRGKTWGGCGNHIAQIMAQIPADQRCVCGNGGGMVILSQTPVPPAPPIRRQVGSFKRGRR